MVGKTSFFAIGLLLFSNVHASENKEVCTAYDANEFREVVSEESYEMPLYISAHDKELKLLHQNRSFFICNETKKSKIKSHRIDKDIRSIDTAVLKKMLQNGRLSVSQSEEGEYKVSMNGRLVGGGPLAGMLAYWLTKTLCYGTAIAAVSGITVASGGLAASATAAAITLGTTGATTAASAAAAAIGAYSATTAAAATSTTAAVITGAGSIGAAVSAIETASIGVGAFFTALWFLP